MEIFVSDEIREARSVLCKACENLTFMQTCSICNCFMPVKTKLPDAYCPEGKWHSEKQINKESLHTQNK